MRLAIEFTSNDLEHSALAKKCRFCSVMLQGILLMQDETWSFTVDTSAINAYAFSGDTLFLEIYFLKEKPRLVLEIFSDIACKGSLNHFMTHYAH